jgi:hypothetical protein
MTREELREQTGSPECRSHWRVALPIWLPCIILSIIALFFSGRHILIYSVRCMMQFGCEEPAPTSVTIAFFGMTSPMLLYLVGAAIADRRLFHAKARGQTRLVAFVGFLLTPFLLYGILWVALMLLIT